MHISFLRHLACLAMVIGLVATHPLAWATPANPNPTLSQDSTLAPASASTSNTPIRFEIISSFLEDVERVLKILAIIAGGGWVYFNFLRGRTYRARLELLISGVATSSIDKSLFVITVTVRNVGLSRVNIKSKGTVCTVSLPSLDRTTKPVIIDSWTSTYISRIFSNHKWVESGETIVEQHLVAFPDNNAGVCQITARVVSTTRAVCLRYLLRKARRIIARVTSTVRADSVCRIATRMVGKRNNLEWNVSAVVCIATKPALPTT